MTLKKPLTEIEKIFSSEYNGTVQILDKFGKPINYKKIAIIPIKNEVYAILKPIILIDGKPSNDGIVFKLVDVNNESELHLVLNPKEEDAVFKIYQNILKK